MTASGRLEASSSGLVNATQGVMPVRLALRPSVFSRVATHLQRQVSRPVSVVALRWC
jgi:hypothetical protein